MKLRILLLLIVAAVLAGCAGGYTLITPGAVSIYDLEVNADSGWNRVPNSRIPWARRGTQVWTQNGLMLDRLVLIPSIDDGDSVYRPNNAIDYPVFRADMDGAALADLLDQTIEMAQGGNLTEVRTTGLRAQRFGDADGVLFELEAIVHDGPAYLGTAGAFVSDGSLYVAYFLGASPYYYEQQAETALATIASARR